MRASSIVGRPPCLHLRFRLRQWACAVALSCCGLLAGDSPATAGVCTVPGTHATIQQAIFDQGCALIDLADQTYTESLLIDRAVSLQGVFEGQTAVAGQVRITSQAVTANLSSLDVEAGCDDFAVQVDAGGQASVALVKVTWTQGLPCPALGILFGDGFETGDAAEWSSTSPRESPRDRVSVAAEPVTRRTGR
ncbi:MAG: hypothetical protein P8Y44_00365 [Acidobacteriota bacterium]